MKPPATERLLRKPPGLAEVEPAIASLMEIGIAVAQQLLDRYPNDPAAFYVAGDLCRRLGDSDQALELWQTCLALDARWTEAQIAIGTLQTERGEFSLAEETFREALRGAPQSSEASILLANALLNQGKHQEMVDLLQSPAQAPGASMPCHLLLGQAWLQLREFDKAKACFDTAVRMAPEYPPALYGLATACARLGRTEEGVRHMRRFREMEAKGGSGRGGRSRPFDDENSVRAPVAIACARAAEVCARHGDATEAAALRRQAGELNPSPELLGPGLPATPDAGN